MNQIAVNELTTYRWSFEDDVRLYAENGIQAIGVWRAKLSDYGEEKGIELLREHGLEVSSLLWAGGFTGSDGRSHLESVIDAREAVMLAAEMDARCLIVYSGARGGHTRRHASRLFQQAIEQVLPFAEEHNVILAVEPMPARCGADFTFLNGIPEAANFVAQFESPHLKLALDTYCLVGQPLDDVQWLGELAEQVAIVQLGDGKGLPGREPNRCLLGQGVVPLGDVMQALTGGGYRGCWEIELVGEDVEATDYLDVLRCSQQTVGELLRR